MNIPSTPLRAVLTATLTLVAQAAGAAAVLPPSDLGAWTCTGTCGASAADGDITLSPLNSAQYGYVSTAGSEALGVSPLTLDPNSRGNGQETNGSRYASGVFQAAAGDQLSMRFNYISTDGKGFDDYAWARVVDAGSGALVGWLFTARSSNSATGNIVPGDVVDKLAFDVKTVVTDYDTFVFTSKTSIDPVNWSGLGFSNGSCWKDNAAGCGFTGWLQSQVSFAHAGSYKIEVGVVNWGDGAFDSGLAFDFAGLTAPVPEPSTLTFVLLGSGMLAVRARRRSGEHLQRRANGAR
jgi:hypothetical protein